MAGDEVFLFDRCLLEKIAGYADLSSDDVVFEVGAGQGNLTEVLAQKAGQVIAFEKNRKHLQKALGKKPQNVSYIPKDAVKEDWPAFNKMVSNIPYSISKKLVLRLIEHGFEAAILCVQKEFAQKISANVGGRNYRMISCATQTVCHVDLLFEIGSHKFKPQPKVDSMVVKLKKKRDLPEGYLDFLKQHFNHRNKKILNINPKAPKFISDKRPKDICPKNFLAYFKEAR